MKPNHNMNDSYTHTSVTLIEKELCEYLGVKRIPRDWNFYIFGGAIRSILKNKKINDVDFLAGPQTIRKLSILFQELGWTREDPDFETNSLYVGLGLITAPHTFVKDGNKVQLIKPNIGFWVTHLKELNKFLYNKSWDLVDEADVEKILLEVLKNVDFTFNAVAYRAGSVRTFHENALKHIQDGVFELMDETLMIQPNPQRLKNRIEKFKNEGWIYIDRNSENSVVSDWI